MATLTFEDRHGRPRCGGCTEEETTGNYLLLEDGTPVLDENGDPILLEN